MMEDQYFQLEHRLVFDFGNEYWLASGDLMGTSNAIVRAIDVVQITGEKLYFNLFPLVLRQL